MKRAQESLVKAALQPKMFRYVDQLTNYLQKHFILHEPGRFLIIPKPYGVSCLGRKTEGGGAFKNSVYNQEKMDEQIEIPSSSQNSTVLEDCLPGLSHAFREPKLQFCVGLKKYLSGAIVLPSNEGEANNMLSSIKYMNQSSQTIEDYHYRCIAILLGTPPESSGSITGYTTFKKVGNHSEYVFVEDKAHKRAKSGKFAVQGTVEYSVIARKHGCSLIEFGVNKFARHLPRLALSSLLCPILGDNLYTQRLAEVNGKPALINPGQRNKQIKQWFPKNLEERLGTSAGELQNYMPLYCHVYRTAFPRFGWLIGKPKSEQDIVDLVASAPPPPHFTAMVEALEMDGDLFKFFQENESSPY